MSAIAYDQTPRRAYGYLQHRGICGVIAALTGSSPLRVRLILQLYMDAVKWQMRKGELNREKVELHVPTIGILRYTPPKKIPAASSNGAPRPYKIAGATAARIDLELDPDFMQFVKAGVPWTAEQWNDQEFHGITPVRIRRWAFTLMPWAMQTWGAGGRNFVRRLAEAGTGRMASRFPPLRSSKAQDTGP